jgi:hypothetical protein
VRELVELMVRAPAVEPKLDRVLAEQAPRVGPLERIVELERRFEDLARNVLERLRPRVRPRNLEIAAFVVIQAVEALTHAEVLYHPEELADDELVDEVVELVVRHLSP